jgi:hypothetical protein
MSRKQAICGTATVLAIFLCSVVVLLSVTDCDTMEVVRTKQPGIYLFSWDRRCRPIYDTKIIEVPLRDGMHVFVATADVIDDDHLFIENIISDSFTLNRTDCFVDLSTENCVISSTCEITKNMIYRYSVVNTTHVGSEETEKYVPLIVDDEEMIFYVEYVENYIVYDIAITVFVILIGSILVCLLCISCIRPYRPRAYMTLV